MPSSNIIVLDLDGVIIKSNFIKHKAMLSLFDNQPEHQAEISTFILKNGGVPRGEKIATILERILGIKARTEVVSDYLTRYAITLENLLISAPLVEGVAEFVTQSEYTFYVCSSAPEDEVESQLIRTSLREHFSGVFGLNTPKERALLKIKHKHPDDNLVFFGDSLGDLHAAQEAHVAFVAVINERDNFINHHVVKIKDFTSHSDTQSCIDEAHRQNATH